jgi:hypothetical protein
MVIALEKRGHPIGRALLAADIGNDREKIKPDVWIAQSCRYMESVPADSSAVRSTLGKRSNVISTTQTPETTANIQ